MFERLNRGPIWELVEQHFEQLEFELERWLDARDAPDFTLPELIDGPEQRVVAHLDALRRAGSEVLDRIAWPALEQGPHTSSLGAALGLAVLQSGDASHCARLVELLEQGPSALDPDAHDRLVQGLVLALVLARREGLDAWLLEWARYEAERGEHPRRLSHLVDVLAERGAAPLELPRLLEHPDLRVARAAARATANRPSSAGGLLPLLEHPDAELRAAAIESALVLQLPGAWRAVCLAAASPESGLRRRAFMWLALLGDADLHAALIERLASASDPHELAALLWALGFSGRSAAFDAALRHVDTPLLAPLVGELGTAIVGLPHDDASLWRARATPTEDQTLPPLEHDDLDADLALQASDHLPIPHPERVLAWWAARRPSSTPPRLLVGQPWTPAALLGQLRGGPMRRVHPLALEWSIRSGRGVRMRTGAWTGELTRELASESPESLAITHGIVHHR